MTILSSSTLIGEPVCNRAGEDLGKIEDIMLNVDDSKVRYAVLSFGGFLGMGDKLFAVPMDAMQLDERNERFVLDVPKEKLENAPGFDKDHWPNMADPTFCNQVNSFYGIS